jgi:hypothetical protein
MLGGYMLLVAIIGTYTLLVLWPPRWPRARFESVIDAIEAVAAWSRSNPAPRRGADPPLGAKASATCAWWSGRTIVP